MDKMKRNKNELLNAERLKRANSELGMQVFQNKQNKYREMEA